MKRWMIIFLLLIGCDQSGRGDPPFELGYGPGSVERFGAPMSIDLFVGDWIFCDDPPAECERVRRLDGRGFRFTADNEYRRLRFIRADSTGTPFQNPDHYCVRKRDDGGRFVLRDDRLRFQPFCCDREELRNGSNLADLRSVQNYLLWRPTPEEIDDRVREWRLAFKLSPQRSDGDCIESEGVLFDDL